MEHTAPLSVIEKEKGIQCLLNQLPDNLCFSHTHACSFLHLSTQPFGKEMCDGHFSFFKWERTI